MPKKVCLLLCLPMLHQAAHAGVYGHSLPIESVDDDQDILLVDGACPEGDTALGAGTAGLEQYDGFASLHAGYRMLTASHIDGSEHFWAWHRVPYTPTEGPWWSDWVGFFYLTCASEVNCLDTVESSTGSAERQSATVSVSCPPGTYALSGGFQVTGQATGVEVDEAMPIGLLVPHGWRASARRLTGSGPWGLRTQARCVPGAVIGEIVVTDTNHVLYGVDVETPDSATFPWLTTDSVRWLAPPTWVDPLRVSAGARMKGPGGLTGLAAKVISSAIYSVTVPVEASYPSIMDESIVVVTPDRTMLGDRLIDCTPRPEDNPLFANFADRFEIGGTVLFGVAAGGKGIIWLPESGPVPIDPQPFKYAFGALPAGVVTYRTQEEILARIDELTYALELDGDGLEVFDTVEQAVTANLDANVLAMVVPDDESEAFAWIADNRSEIADSEHTTLIAVLEGSNWAEQLQ